MNRSLMRGIKKFKGNQPILRSVSIRKDCPFKDADVTVLSSFSPSPGTSAVLNQERTIKNGCQLAMIVPVFNVETYIRQCIQSLLAQQTNYRYQVILIDDGTQDESIHKIEDLLSDERISLVVQENRGLSGARNRGLDCIDAEYVTFVDADDYLNSDMVERMLCAAYAYSADIVAGSYHYYYEKSGIKRKVSCPAGKLENYNNLSGLACGKILRADLFRQIRFPEGYWFEDTIMKHLIYPKAKTIYGIPEIMYVYRLRAGSISNSYYGRPKSLDSTWITCQMLNDRKKLGLSNDERYLCCFLKQLALNYQREYGLQEEIRRQVFYWMAGLIRMEFPQCFGENLSGGFKKLYQALLYYDYQAYCRLCFWL